MIERKWLPSISSKKIRIYECKLCGYKGTRKDMRKHIRKKHLWQDKKSLSVLIKSQEF
jgi:Zn ribbon nucleic-acid-binding protein